MGKESKNMGRYMYMYNWCSFLYTWKQCNIVNQLYSNKNCKKNSQKCFGMEDFLEIIFLIILTFLPILFLLLENIIFRHIYLRKTF